MQINFDSSESLSESCQGSEALNWPAVPATVLCRQASWHVKLRFHIPIGWVIHSNNTPTPSQVSKELSEPDT